MSPFDSLIINLQGKVWHPVGGSKSVNVIDGKIFIIQQLRLLRSAYISLVEVADEVKKRQERMKGTTEVPFVIAALDHAADQSNVILSFNSFVSVLYQLNRVLPIHFPGCGDIPNYPRIRFYRNKAVEHWDEYVASVPGTGFTFKFGKAAIPVIEGDFEYPKRQILLQEVKAKFKVIGGNFVWVDEAYNMLGCDKAYCDAVFKALEGSGKMSLHKGKNSDFDSLISLLLRFGFPAPFNDVEEYCDLLVAHISRFV
ncbi:MAG: hypothetical protein WCT08_00320 [Patescibacteria group bacterium]